MMRNLLVPQVWAPAARRVDVDLDGKTEAMHRDPDREGWWLLRREVQAGTRYAFRIDGGNPLPDPRSLSQPDGVHGPSEIVAPNALTNRPAWPGKNLRGGVGYELHVGTFTPGGTFDSAIEKLPHLVDLGVDFIEVLPVATFPGDWGWGYDGVGLYAVHAAYGGPEAFVRFIDAAHAHGLGVVLDVVHNHLGPEGNYLSQFGPYFTGRHHTPWGEAVNLDDDGSDEVRAFLLGSVQQWLVDFQLDGLRLDAVHALVDDTEPHFLAELADFVDSLEEATGRPLLLIAESDLNDVAMVSPTGSAPCARGMDAQWADDVHHALHSFFTGETQGYYVDFGTAETLAKALSCVFVHDGGHSTFRDRDWGKPVDQDSDVYDGHSFVVFLQNHDQVGNRATGDRIGATIAPGAQAAAAALYVLGPFAPMLFMGEEWSASTPFPFFSHLGPELGPMVTQGRAREFAAMGWGEATPDPQSQETFRSAILRWDELEEPEHARMHAWYRQLLQLRRNQTALQDPDLAQVVVEVLDADTIHMQRGDIAVIATRATGPVQTGLGDDEEILTSWGNLDGGHLQGPGVVVARTSR